MSDRRERLIREVTYTYPDRRPGSPSPFVSFSFRIDEQAGDVFSPGGDRGDEINLVVNEDEKRKTARDVRIRPGYLWREEETFKSVRVGDTWLNEGTPQPKAKL